MQNISFDDGHIDLSINGDESKIIRIYPSDIALIERFNDAINNIEEKIKSLPDDVEINQAGEAIEQLGESAQIIRETRQYVNEQIDYIFDSPVSKTVFGNQSPLSSPGGEFLVERFLNAVAPVINKTIQADVKAREARIKKYTGQVKKK
ncbi:hypothetical protein [Anaerocolumna chitinilytica]|uniref:Uncharacterized protein n=1 Tax=Anaerocolumna chitinilytica TaxID=1727145 RepID=A0A7M3SAI0_9FIRM|nr:hypothetical protein [Anaerocolumna chitinilytica]BCK01598.1 hypothetical protein bsdcttw_46380 [Anaerocolumna chitinilytica]